MGRPAPGLALGGPSLLLLSPPPPPLPASEVPPRPPRRSCLSLHRASSGLSPLSLSLQQVWALGRWAAGAGLPHPRLFFGGPPPFFWVCVPSAAFIPARELISPQSSLRASLPPPPLSFWAPSQPARCPGSACGNGVSLEGPSSSRARGSSLFFLFRQPNRTHPANPYIRGSGRKDQIKLFSRWIPRTTSIFLFYFFIFKEGDDGLSRSTPWSLGSY